MQGSDSLDMCRVKWTKGVEDGAARQKEKRKTTDEVHGGGNVLLGTCGQPTVGPHTGAKYRACPKGADPWAPMGDVC